MTKTWSEARAALAEGLPDSSQLSAFSVLARTYTPETHLSDQYRRQLLDDFRSIAVVFGSEWERFSHTIVPSDYSARLRKCGNTDWEALVAAFTAGSRWAGANAHGMGHCSQALATVADLIRSELQRYWGIDIEHHRLDPVKVRTQQREVDLKRVMSKWFGESSEPTEKDQGSNQWIESSTPHDIKQAWTTAAGDMVDLLRTHFAFRYGIDHDPLPDQVEWLAVVYQGTQGWRPRPDHVQESVFGFLGTAADEALSIAREWNLNENPRETRYDHIRTTAFPQAVKVIVTSGDEELLGKMRDLALAYSDQSSVNDHQGVTVRDVIDVLPEHTDIIQPWVPSRYAGPVPEPIAEGIRVALESLKNPDDDPVIGAVDSFWERGL